MKDNPETVLYDYKYDCIDKSDVYTLDENPCNANFFTERPADWLRGCISYYNGLYTKGELKHKPQIKATRSGQQLRVCGENEQECQISIFVYKTGVVTIQGCDCDEWEHKDMLHIKTLLIDSDTANIQDCTADRSHIESSIADVSIDTPSKSSFSARKFPMAASLKISSFIKKKTPPKKESTDDISQPTDSSPSSTMADTQSISSLDDDCTHDLISISVGRKLPVSSTPINTKQTENILSNSEEKQIQELLNSDENSLDDNVPEYDPNSSTIKEHTDCHNCEILKIYINHCEKAMNSLQEELYQLKAYKKDKATDQDTKKKKERLVNDKNNKVTQVSKEKQTPRDFVKDKNNKVTQVSKEKHTPRN